jgi:ubiquinone/menaquinone biosynthesis C-methylase UbiE
VSSYVGKYAEYYNLIYADKPYKHEAEFVHRCIQRHSAGQTRRLLELACGTGRHARELEELGYAIIATDYSEDLLAVARNSAKAAGSRVEFRFGDMRSLEVGGEAFDAVYCLFDSIGYAQTNEAILSVLHFSQKHFRVE